MNIRFLLKWFSQKAFASGSTEFTMYLIQFDIRVDYFYILYLGILTLLQTSPILLAFI